MAWGAKGCCCQWEAWLVKQCRPRPPEKHDQSGPVPWSSRQSRGRRWEGFIEKVGFQPGVKEWWMMMTEMSWQVNEEVSRDTTMAVDSIYVNIRKAKRSLATVGQASPCTYTNWLHHKKNGQRYLLSANRKIWSSVTFIIVMTYILLKIVNSVVTTPVFDSIICVHTSVVPVNNNMLQVYPLWCYSWISRYLARQIYQLWCYMWSHSNLVQYCTTEAGFRPSNFCSICWSPCCIWLS